MEQMLANGIQLIKTNSSYVFDGDTVFYRNEIPFKSQSNDFDISDCYLAQPIDFTDISVLQFLSTEASVTCVVKDYLGNTLDTINATNVGTYDTQNVFNLEIDWSTIVGNLESCYLQITDGTEYFKSEPLRSINPKQRIKIRYRMLRNHKSIGYFFNPNDEAYQFSHIFYIEAAITEFKREIVKSVFEDSNQTLLNLFGTFRHSFLLKTFQIPYYLHEKAVTLSLCDEIYLSEIREGNEYEGRIFLSKDETPQEEIIESTNLYISSTRYVVDKAFRLVGAAQETPIVPEPNFGIVPIHHTNPNGKKSTFQTPYKLLPSKTLYTPQGNPTDYLFKIGGSADNYRNSHDPAWDSIPSKTFAEFSALTVNEESHVQVRYIGTLTQTDIVAVLYAPISDAPLNPSTRTIKPNPKTANNDFLIYPKLVTGFDSVGISTGAATRFSQQRTFVELANSQDLTDFNSGIANLPITQEDGIGHLYLERTNTTPLTVNITTNQADPLKEIIAYATPTNNEFYPVTPDGSNILSFESDQINDRCYLTDVTDFIFENTLDFESWQIGRSCSFFTNHYASGATAEAFFGAGAGSSTGRLTIYSWGCAFAGVSFGRFASARIGYWRNCFVITKTAASTLNVKTYINGGLLYDETKTYSASNFNVRKAEYNANNRIFLDNPTAAIAGNMLKRQSDIWILFRAATTEEIRRFALGQISFIPNLHWDFKQNTGATIPELIGGYNATLFDTDNSRRNYFV